MDRYNSKLAIYLARKRGVPNWAITIGQTSYFSCSEAQVDPAWHRHEDRHKAQWREQGFFKFLWLYLKYSRDVGYFNNPFEIDARAHEE